MDLTEKDILELDLRGAFQAFLQEEEGKNNKNKQLHQTLYQEIRFGKNIKFDLYNYLEQIYLIKQKRQIVKIDGSAYYLKDFYTEIEERERKLKKYLIQCITNEHPAIGCEN